MEVDFSKHRLCFHRVWILLIWSDSFHFQIYKLVKSKEKPYFSITVSRKTDGITTIPRISPTDKRADNNTTCYLIKTATKYSHHVTNDVWRPIPRIIYVKDSCIRRSKKISRESNGYLSVWVIFKCL